MRGGRREGGREEGGKELKKWVGGEMKILKQVLFDYFECLVECAVYKYSYMKKKNFLFETAKF